MTRDYLHRSSGMLVRTSAGSHRNMDTVTTHKPLLSRSMTRRRVLRTIGGATGVALSSRVWMPALAQRQRRRDVPATDAQPNPIPGGFELDSQFFHVNLPNSGGDESTIFDFQGVLGSTLFRGTGTTGDGVRRGFHTDVRFMRGSYVAADGNQYTDTFAFV